MNYEDWNDSAQSFESSLMILRKDKNGWVIGFSVHPNEAPTALLEVPLGTRFRAVLFQIGDDEQPVILEEVRDGKKVVAMAGEMCRNPDFQKFIWEYAGKVNVREEDEVASKEDNYEEIAASLLRGIIDITSRSELGSDKEAQGRFKDLMEEYRRGAVGEKIRSVTREEDYPF